MPSYFVYRAVYEKYHYYGMTNNISNRRRSHAKSIFELIKSGNYLKSHNETGYLSFHHKVANLIVKNNRSKSLSVIELNLFLNECFITNIKSEALHVESFLIYKSLHKLNCCNLMSGIRKYENIVSAKRIYSPKNTKNVKV